MKFGNIKAYSAVLLLFNLFEKTEPSAYFAKPLI